MAKTYLATQQDLSDLEQTIVRPDTGIDARLGRLEQGTNTTDYDQSKAYKLGQIVYKDGHQYRANADITANTVFAKGTSGQTWRAIAIDPTETAVFESNISDGVNVSGSIAYDYGSLRIKSVKAGVDLLNADPGNSDPEYVPPLSDFESSLYFDPELGKMYHSIKETRRLDSSVTSQLKTMAAFDDVVLNSDDFTFTSNVLEPKTHDLVELGSLSKSFKSGYFQHVNFQSSADTNEGNIDADAGSLGVFGVTELALGYGNNNKDLTFTSAGVTVNKDLLITNGNNLKFRDSDGDGPEGVNIKMNGNDLSFYGVNQGSQASTPALTITYDGKLRELPVERAGTVEIERAKSGNSWQPSTIPGLLDDNIKMAYGSSGFSFSLNTATSGHEVKANFIALGTTRNPSRATNSGTNASYTSHCNAGALSSAFIILSNAGVPNVHWEITATCYNVGTTNSNTLISYKRIIKKD